MPHARAQEDDKPWIKSLWKLRENLAEGQWQSLGECLRKVVTVGMATGQKVLKDPTKANGRKWRTLGAPIRSIKRGSGDGPGDLE